MRMNENKTRNVSHVSEPGERSVGKAKTFEEWLESREIRRKKMKMGRWHLLITQHLRID
jgi:hypothetical protein